MKPSRVKIQWTESLLIKTFGLQKVPEGFPVLDQWLAMHADITTAEKERLGEIRMRLLKNGAFWSEEDLKMKFIALLLDMVGYEDGDEGYNTYYDKDMTAIVEGQRISVRADFTIATGVGEIMEQPFFCFHEYKRFKKGSDDPIGQVLCAMLIAEKFNEREQPIYGCFVMGSAWYFMAKEKNQYAVSKSFDAQDDEEMFHIVRILRSFKTIIKEQLRASAS